jgi:uncharacterized protein
MIKRKFQALLKKMATKMPIISITGPRQSGKTTLARETFNNYRYVSLENPDTLEEAKSDPRLFLSRHKRGIIIDEVQVIPELFSYIQALSDERNKVGEFILTGSQNFLLSSKISQSLAGRTFISHLLPFSLEELDKTKFKANKADRFIYNGFYPRIYDRGIAAELFYPSYIQSYAERDVRQIINVSSLHLFQKFMRLAAGRVGQLLNYHTIAVELGVDQKTVKSWFSILEASFIVFFLQPHYKNFSKRLVKTPKLYFYDTGLACNLLGLKGELDVSKHWAKGALFENLIIADLMKNYFNRGLRPPLFFWRNNTGHEVDCVIDESTHLKALEVKSGTTINSDFFKGLTYFRELSKESNKELFLIYGGSENYQRKEGKVVSWRNTIRCL